MKRLLLIVLFVLLSASCEATRFAAPSTLNTPLVLLDQSSAVFPYNYAGKKFSVTGGSIKSLSERDNEGLDDNFSDYLEFNTAQNHSNVVIFFDFITSDLKNKKLVLNYKGSTISNMKYEFFIRNYMTNKWVKLGDNQDVSSWYWSTLEFSIPAADAGSFSKQGQARVKVLGRKATEPILIDYMALEALGTTQVCSPGITDEVSCTASISNAQSATQVRVCNVQGTGYNIGSCSVQSCNQGYEISGNTCVEEVSQVCTPGSTEQVSCTSTIVNAASAIQINTCNSAGSAYNQGSCQLQSCQASYVVNGNTCEVDSSGGGSTGVITVTPVSSSATFNNPERGFYNYVVMSDTSQHAANVQAGSTLAISIIKMPNFINSSLSQSFLNSYEAMFTAARSAGVKLILRHSYHENMNFTSDPSESRILGHIAQLTPIISANKDVVLNLHAGFVGAWGEWYYTQHDNSVRKNVLEALLNGVPSEINVSLRTPAFKISMFNMTGPNQPGVDAALARRVGHHNDCFVAGPDDFGTGGGYSLSNPSDWRDFIGEEAKQLAIPVGGETCAPAGTISACANATTQLERQGFSYLNIDYHLTVLDSWRAGGCFEDINKKLGYRFKLNEFSVNQSLSKSGTLNLSMKLENEGYVAMIKSRAVKLVLFNSSSQKVIDLNLDPKQWGRGIHEITQSIELSSHNFTAGSYKLAIWMPDSNSSLESRSDYAVQFANKSTWDNSKGWNVVKDSEQEDLVINLN